jgi:hypothetical protein
VDFHVELPEIYPASFSFSPAIADGTLAGYQMCDWIDNAVTLQMESAGQEIYGYIHLPCRVEVNSPMLGEQAAAPEDVGGTPAARPPALPGTPPALREKRIG